ncbi:MAG: Na+/H+ antiporter subunit E [Rhizobiaceae bacterium]|nr:Na+/H+ antiporter subunit E [Rhizobiaceae bacterium]
MIRPFRILKLLAVFLREFAVSVFRVARLVLSPTMRFTPAAFRFPLALTGDRQITLLANMITLTPGTLTVDVADDRSALIIHAIDCPDIEAARAEIRDGFERLIREAFA